MLQGTRYFPNAPLGEAVLTLAAEQEQERFDQLGEGSIFGDPTQRQSLTHRSLLAVAGWRPGIGSPSARAVGLMITRHFPVPGRAGLGPR